MSIGRKVFVLLASLWGVQATEPDAHGAFIFNIQQVGQNVIVTGSGTINTAALPVLASNPRSSAIGPAGDYIDAGPTTLTPAEELFGLVGPLNFGTGGQTNASSGSGDIVGIELGNRIVLPSLYTSGAPLADSATFNSQTFNSLGLTQGIYVYTWGSGPTADSLTINIGTVPEPASFAAAGIPAAVALLRRRRHSI